MVRLQRYIQATMSSRALTTLPEKTGLAQQMGDAVLGFVSRIPSSKEPISSTPAARAEALTQAAARAAALTAGGLALPPGPLGWLTLVPELMAVWRVQAQLVSDIAALYGRQATMTREQMIYCLFKHMASQAVRDLTVRLGERFIVRQLTTQATRALAGVIGLRISERVLSKGVSRWLPVVGAMGVGAYAYYDTRQVAKTAVALFEREIELAPAD
ncbi:EcsC family protein [Roseateles toxinivorans]|uniref:EcsC family protein n=2 Tax=Roseateles toxinivorans TaxID=270368 RepID=A0A4R6QQL8_9BURK|nr:EcsC family protein [Roseateles toxinivorans]